MRPRRPLRSVWLGNPRYLSVYGLGVGQAMGLMGHWHRSVSIFDDLDSVVRQIAEMAPDVIWTHMALWPPSGALAAEQIAEVLAAWKRRGSAVFLHDGDPRERAVTVDVGYAFSIALVNRSVDGPASWPIACMRWPYAAMTQREIAEPRSEWAYDLVFAGNMRSDGDGLYGERAAFVFRVQDRLGPPRMRIVSPGGGDTNNRMLVADVAASANAILGFARPEVPGWIDTRVFQYPGAGGVLIHDNAGEFLVPDEHYLQFDRSDPDSVIRAVERARAEGPAIRERAFRHVQGAHTWVHRSEAALTAFYGR